MATKGLDDSRDRRERGSHDNSAYNSEMGDGKGKETDKDRIYNEINKARRYLADGHTQKAIERANEAMKQVNKTFGNSAELLPCYFVLAEAFIEEGKNKKAEDYLIQAYWNIVKHDKDNKQPGEEEQNQAVMSEEQHAINKATLHKVFARLYTAKEQTDKAMDHITEGIYLDTKRFGPENVNIAISYYTIANIFAKQGKLLEAQIYYAKAVELWYRFLKEFFKSDEQIEEPDEILYKQALSMLKNIEMAYLNYQRDGKEIQEEALIELNYTMALLYRLMNDDALSIEYARTLARLMLDKYGELHKKYLSMQRLLPYNFSYDPDFQKPQQGYLMHNEDPDPMRLNDSHPVFDDNSMVQPNSKMHQDYDSVDHEQQSPGQEHQGQEEQKEPYGESERAYEEGMKGEEHRGSEENPVEGEEVEQKEDLNEEGQEEVVHREEGGEEEGGEEEGEPQQEELGNEGQQEGGEEQGGENEGENQEGKEEGENQEGDENAIKEAHPDHEEEAGAEDA